MVHRDVQTGQRVPDTARRRDGTSSRCSDFGLVKVRDPQGAAELTMTEATLAHRSTCHPRPLEHSNEVDARRRPLLVGAVVTSSSPVRRCSSCLTLGEGLDAPGEGPARAALRTVGPSPVSPDLEELLMRCLAKNPASRPANARELDDALARLPERGGLDARSWPTSGGRQIAATQSRETTRR